MSTDDRTRIFISCGQADDTEEIRIANEVASKLGERGFEPYVAKSVQSLASIRENVFRQLRDTEYFLFIDFRRELIVPFDLKATPSEHRGSPFSHQELAIASFLDIPLLAFRESGVKQLDGLVSAVQANCIPFSDRLGLPEQICAEVSRRGWRPDWRNTLELRLSKEPSRAFRRPEQVWGYFYHIEVHNRHRYSYARDCTAYLRNVVDVGTGAKLEYEFVELKWAGFVFPTALIAPGSYRKLDAVWIAEPDPMRARFNAFADSTEYIPQMQGPGTWELTYEVHSSTVPGDELAIRLTLGEEIASPPTPEPHPMIVVKGDFDTMSDGETEITGSVETEPAPGAG